MPIYEYYCADCHRLFRFLSRRVAPDRRPDCPRCGCGALERRPSTFAISRGAVEAGDDTGAPDVDPTRLERAMESLSAEAQGLDDDPRRAAGLVRRLYDEAGLRLGGQVEEALRRLEAGEDPETIEADLGDDPGEDDLVGTAKGTVSRRLRRRLVPPSIDPELHEL